MDCSDIIKFNIHRLHLINQLFCFCNQPEAFHKFDRKSPCHSEQKTSEVVVERDQSLVKLFLDISKIKTVEKMC